MQDEDDSYAKTPDLAQLLVLEAGRLMENASTSFAETLPIPGPERAAKLDRMLDTIEAVHLLVAAAASLNSQGELELS